MAAFQFMDNCEELNSFIQVKRKLEVGPVPSDHTQSSNLVCSLDCTALLIREAAMANIQSTDKHNTEFRKRTVQSLLGQWVSTPFGWNNTFTGVTQDH